VCEIVQDVRRKNHMPIPRTFLVPSLACFSVLVPAAEQATPSTTQPLAASPATATEIISVDATRLESSPVQQPYGFHRTNRTDMDERPARLGIDAIDFTPGVFVQHTASNQASPYVRGLTGEQSLLMLDGVRLNHAANRPGPNQYSAFIPGSSLSSIDVILGSTATVMGSDGHTGAVDMRLAGAGRGVDKIASPWVGTRLGSADMSVLAEGGVDGRVGDFLYSVEGGYGYFDDLTGGKDSGTRIADENFRANVVPGISQGSDNEIPNSHFATASTAARVAYVGLEDQRFELSGGFMRHMDAPRPDGYYENSAVSTPLLAGSAGQPRRISRYYDPQDFSYVHGRHIIKNVGVFNRIQSTLWWHNVREDQYRERFNSGALTQIQRDEWKDKVSTVGADIQFTNIVAVTHELTYGGTWYTDRTSNSFMRNDNGTITTPAGQSTVPNDSRYDGLGVFAQDLWRFAERWDLLVGLRYSRYAWDYTATDDRSGYSFIDGNIAVTTPGASQEFSDSADAITGNARLGFHPVEQSTIFIGGGQGFRAPNLTNLAGNDLRASVTTVQASPDLKPEKSWTVDTGAKWQDGRDSASIGVFYTQIDDLIQPVYTTPTTAVQGNAEKAWLSGGEIAFDWTVPLGSLLPVGHRLAIINVSGEADQLQPNGSTLEVNLSRSNRLFGMAGLRYDLGSAWWSMLRVRWSDVYDEIGPGDAADTRYTTAPSANGIPGSVPGYAVLDLHVGWVDPTKKYRAQIGLENLTDKTYREPGSGIDGAGLSGVLSLGARF
jgi:hemoglobin/transferrin/lactoferrin receptor protein